MKRLVFLALVALSMSALGVAAAPATAVGPAREPGSPFNADIPAGAVCPFELQVTTVAFHVTVKTYFDKAGNVTRITSQGKDFIQLTNVGSGKTIVVNASGPGTFTFNPDGSIDAVGGGLGLLLLGPADAGGPGAFLISGHVHLVISSTGQITTFEVKGTVRDLCAELQ